MKHTFTLIAAFLLSLGTGVAQHLLPMPQEVIWTRGKTIDTPHVEFRQGGHLRSAEAYEVHITRDSVIVMADGELGFLRARQTLAQLAPEGGPLPCGTIKDAPAYEWRGVMLDVSRHFLPVDFLKKHIDVLASYKINQLHLHLTDAAGWRMQIKRYHRLTSLGAWRTHASWKEWWAGPRLYAEEGCEQAHGGYYTQDELRELVRYAAERGINIVPEIEMPAHSEEVLTAYPELSCTHEPYKQADFCPGSVATYDFLEHVLEEVMEVFPSPYIHVGGDEAGKVSWKTCPLCQQKVKELGLTSTDELQPHLIRHMAHFLNRHGRTLIGWDEITHPTLPQEAAVMVWRSIDKAAEAARLGHDVVLSPGTHCYLDFYQDAPPTQPQAIGGYTTLERVYSFNPLAHLTESERKHIKGVQGNVWAEYIETEAHREYMLYPRILAIAEIGWNGTQTKNYAEFYKRAVHETDRLRAWGIHAFNLRTEAGQRAEYHKPVAHKARGAKVTYNLPYSKHYPAADEATLTDGLSGGWDNNDGRWQGFIGKGRLDVTIDLSKPTRFRTVSTSFMQSCGPEIFFPGAYTVSVSHDGKTFKQLHHQEIQEEKTDNPAIKTWTCRTKAHARYIRIQAKPSRFSGWIFADEVVVK